MFQITDFHHRLTGPEGAQPWVFLHGLMGSAANWRRITTTLESSFRCLAYDQRGHGRSVQPGQGYSPDDYASDLKEILDDLNWESVVLVGHSMGGRNALRFTELWPERVKALVIEDIGLKSKPGNLDYYRHLLGVVPVPFADRAQARHFFSNEFLSRAKTRENPKMIAEFFYSNLDEKPGQGVSWRFSAAAILESVEKGAELGFPLGLKHLENWKVPTLWVRGERSPELSPEELAEIEAQSNIIQCVTIPNAGHWVHFEQPELFVQAMKDFVTGSF